jgi:membrane protein YqaA with SNARE-associated domain
VLKTSVLNISFANVNFIELGYLGMFVAALLAATFIPLGSEVVFTGLLAVDFNPIWLIIVATVGNTTGGMITYYLGKLGKWQWLEKWFGISKNKLEVNMHRIQKWGGVLAFFTWLPVVGDPLAAALGFARTKLLPTIFWMTVGKLLRFVLLAWVFYAFEWKELF